MSANLVFLVVVAFLLIGLPALETLAVKLGLKWAKIADISFLRAFGLYLLLVLASGAIGVGAMIAQSVAGGKRFDLAIEGIGALIHLIIPCWIVASIYKVRFWRAALGLVPFLVCGVAIVAFVSVERMFIYHAFHIPTNAMAPTLLGEHLEAPCPRCGAPAYGSPIGDRPVLPPDGWPMVCSKEMTTVKIANPPKASGGGDSIFVCKLLKPNRWDLIVFHNPQNPSVDYAKRLVGLPGEKLEIR